MAGEKRALKLSVTRAPHSNTLAANEVRFSALVYASFVGYNADPRIRVSWDTEGNRKQSFGITITRRQLIDMLSMIETVEATGPNPSLEVTKRPLSSI
jgi:hypothetical protein